MECSLHLRGIRDVCLQEAGVRAESAGQFAPGINVDIYESHARAFAAERFGDGSATPFAAPVTTTPLFENSALMSVRPYFPTLNPPSMISADPVINADSSLAR